MRHGPTVTSQPERSSKRCGLSCGSAGRDRHTGLLPITAVCCCAIKKRPAHKLAALLLERRKQAQIICWRLAALPQETISFSRCTGRTRSSLPPHVCHKSFTCRCDSGAGRNTARARKLENYGEALCTLGTGSAGTAGSRYSKGMESDVHRSG